MISICLFAIVDTSLMIGIYRFGLMGLHLARDAWTKRFSALIAHKQVINVNKETERVPRTKACCCRRWKCRRQYFRAADIGYMQIRPFINFHRFRVCVQRRRETKIKKKEKTNTEAIINSFMRRVLARHILRRNEIGIRNWKLGNTRPPIVATTHMPQQKNSYLTHAVDGPATEATPYETKINSERPKYW